MNLAKLSKIFTITNLLRSKFFIVIGARVIQSAHLVLLILILSSQWVFSGDLGYWNIVSTIVGDGFVGYAEGAGTNARFNYPADIVFGPDNSLYVADTGNGRIRKLMSSDGGGTWTTSLIAGDGGFGYIDGTGSGARFASPFGITIGIDGSLYIADTYNNRIRKLTTSDGGGTWTTSSIAGDGIGGYAEGSGAAAQFNAPQSIAADADGNLYVADTGNVRIRKLTTSDGGGTWITSSILGDGTHGYAEGTGAAARFNNLTSIAFGPDGSIYMPDGGNCRIRKAMTSDGGLTWTTSLVAGDGTEGHNEGIGAAAQFWGPYGVTVGGDGTIYVAEATNHCIRKIKSSGETSLVAGKYVFAGNADGIGAAAEFMTPKYLAEKDGSLYIASNQHGIRKIDGSQIYINTNTYTAPTYDGTITLTSNKIFTRMDSDPGGEIATNGYHITFGKNTTADFDSLFEGVISGAGKLTVNTNKILSLNGANTYSGGTDLEAGTISTNNNGSLGTGAFRVGGSGGTLQTAASVAIANTITLNRPLTIDSNAFDSTFSGNITGTSNLTKSGNGILTVTGTNTYSGTTTVNAGTLKVDATTAVPSATALILANTAGATFDISGAGGDVTVGSISGGGTTGGNVVLGANRLTAGGNNTSTSYGGVISGTGGFTKVGTGTTALTGGNTFAGNVEIQAGTLEISDNSVLGNANNDITFSTNPGILKINNATTLPLSRSIALNSNATIHNDFMVVIDSVISGAGSLTKTGSGILSLGVNNTYTGLTIINGGVLRGNFADIIQSGLVILNGIFDLNGNSQNLVTNLEGGTNAGIDLGSASLTVTNTSDSVFSGVISGSGTFNKKGPNKLTLEGANTSSGQMNVDEGTLEFTGDTTNLSSNLVLASGADVSFNQSNDSVFGGTISGNGYVKKEGTHRLVISGTSTHTGPTLVNDGELKINGTISNSPVTVAATAKISGSGSVYDLISHGTVTPGNSIGTLTVNHDLTFAPTNVYECEVNAAGQSDNIIVMGNATIGGTLKILAAPGTYTAANVYTALQANTITGSYPAPTIIPSNLIFNFITSDPQKIQFTLRGGISFAEIALDGNPGQVARYLDGLRGAADDENFMVALRGLTGKELYHALNQLHPASNAVINERISAVEMGMADHLFMNTRIKRMIKTIKKTKQDVAAEFISRVVKTQLDVQSTLKELKKSRYYDNNRYSKISNLPERREFPLSSRAQLGNASFWVQGYGDHFSQNNIRDTSLVSTPGISSNAWGSNVGADYLFSDELTIGITGGYGHINYTLNNTYGDGDVSTFRLGAYALWQVSEDMYLNGSLSYAHHKLKGKRQISFTGFTDTKTQEHRANQVSGQVETGYEVSISDLIVTPYAGMGFFSMHEQGYTEVGKNGSGLSIKSHITNTIQGKLGGQLSKVIFVLEDANVLGYLKLGYIYRRGLGRRETFGSNFISAGGNFDVFVRNKIRNIINPAIGVTTMFSNQMYIGLAYNGEIAKAQKSHEGLLKFGWKL